MANIYLLGNCFKVILYWNIVLKKIYNLRNFSNEQHYFDCCTYLQLYEFIKKVSSHLFFYVEREQVVCWSHRTSHFKIWDVSMYLWDILVFISSTNFLFEFKKRWLWNCFRNISNLNKTNLKDQHLKLKNKETKTPFSEKKPIPTVSSFRMTIPLGPSKLTIYKEFRVV